MKQTIYLCASSNVDLARCLQRGNLSPLSILVWDSPDIPGDWVLIQEIEIDTSHLDEKEIFQNALIQLDAAEKKVRSEYQEKLDNLDQTRRSLLALPHLES